MVLDYTGEEVQSNPINADAKGATETVRIKRGEFRENVRAFFPMGQSKLSVIMTCPNEPVSVERGLTVINSNEFLCHLILFTSNDQAHTNRND